MTEVRAVWPGDIPAKYLAQDYGTMWNRTVRRLSKKGDISTDIIAYRGDFQ
jgi:hypothetical protein